MKKKLIFWLVALLLIVGIGQADWYYNPATGQIDYYEPVSGANFEDLANVTLTGAANGNVLYYNGTRWVNLAVGAAGEVLTVAAGRPAWTAAAGGAPVGASYMTLGLNGVLTAERVLTAGAGIAFADTGANGTLTISSIPDLANIFYVSATGGDYATITSALAAENAGGEVFLVGPGTYANDQIDFSANNQTVIGMGDQDDVHVTQADTTVIPFGAFTDCVVMNVHVEVTAPTTAAADVITGTGGLTLFDVHVELSNTNVVVADQPACMDTTGIVLMNRGWIEYANTGNDGDGTTAIKAAVRIGAGAVVWFDHTVFTVSGGNQSLALTSSYATAGLISFYRCNVDVNDDASSNTIGIVYSNMAAGTHEMFGNDIHVDNSANIAHGVFLINADTIRSMYNHIHITGGTAYGLNAEAGTTIISQFDDIVATTPTTGAGTLTIMHSEADGNLTLSGTITTANIAGAAIGSDVQAWDTDLDTYAGISPSANVQTLLANATFALFMADLSGTAGAGFSFNSQALTSVGAIGSGNIVSTGTGSFAGASVTTGDADTAGSLIVSDGSTHTQTISTGALDASITFVLPVDDGDNLDFLQTAGDGTLSWVPGAGGDAFTLKVDAGATADYFGVAGGDGLFRFTANHFTMADGGNFVTLSLADHATARAALGLEIGVDVQAYDADLTTYAGITPSANVQTLLANATFALFLADLSATAGAAFDWGGQNLTNIGSIAPTSVDSGGVIASASHVQIEDSNELRFYEGANYVGFEPPALGANQIWVLPAADGVAGQVMQTSGGGAGALTWVNNTSGSMATDDLWAAQGDLAYGNADDVGVILSFNYDGDILRLNATVPYWDTPGIANTNPVVIDDDNVADDEYARFTANGLESRTAAEVLSNIGAQPLNTVLTELTNLTDPAADQFPFWNDTTNDFEFSTVIAPTATGITVGAAGNAGKLELEDADADVLSISVGVQVANTDYVWPTAFGTTGFVLSSTDAGVMSWVANSSGSMATDTLWNAAGDLAYASADDTGAILAIGSAADFLRVNGGIPYWDSPGIANTNPVVIDSADAADDEFARFTANGLESRTAAEVMTDLPGATTGAPGKSELTTTAEVSAGTDTTRAVTADALAGSTIGRKSMVWKLTANDEVIVDQDDYDSILVPADFAGWLITGVAARIVTADDGADFLDVGIYNVTQTAEILSTLMRIEAGEFSTLTSAQPGVIDVGEDDITAADVIRIDVDYAGDNCTGLEVHITFERVT